MDQQTLNSAASNEFVVSRALLLFDAVPPSKLRAEFAKQLTYLTTYRRTAMPFRSRTPKQQQLEAAVAAANPWLHLRTLCRAERTGGRRRHPRQVRIPSMAGARVGNAGSMPWAAVRSSGRDAFVLTACAAL